MDHVLSAADYIKRTGRDPMVWGVNDCACWAATFWQEATGFDPAAALRGTYGSKWDCRRVVMASGGLVTLCRQLMAGQPQGDGDGICVAQAQGQTVAGIMSGGRLWLKGDGMVISPADYTIFDRWTVCPKR